MANKFSNSFVSNSTGFISKRRIHSLSVCVVGSGPAGFYTADKILKSHEDAKIDIIDRLPTPFGLVRSGVAPDHAETKIVTNQFARVAEDKRCAFFGNVTVGLSISLSELQELYDVVVLAYGAESDRALGIPGEDLSGILSAREFVWWYNGHPDCENLNPDLLSTETAVVLGQGNVALDAARILLRPADELAKTDIASHALHTLERNAIRKIFLVGRRGPAQSACTAKELRELLGLQNLSIHIDEVDFRKSPKDEEELKGSRVHRRIYELLSKAATSPTSYSKLGQKELHFVFFRKPEAFFASAAKPKHVAGIHFEKTVLEGNAGEQIAVGTGQYEDFKCGFVLKSIGYKSVPVDDLPFDNRKGVVPNLEGRIAASEHSGTAKKGLYVTGWLKRGPTGIIGTNMYCAEQTVASINEDARSGVLAPSLTRKAGRVGLKQLLDDRNVRYVPFSGWKKIDAEELRLGSLRNKPREKLTSWHDLLRVAIG